MILFLRERPWSAIPLSNDPLDPDADWSEVEQACLDLIRAMASTDIGFGNRENIIWAILEKEIKPRNILLANEVEALDPFENASNASPARALYALLQFMAYEHNLGKDVRPDATNLLTQLLKITGQTGIGYRKVLGPQLGFLQSVASDWVEEHHNQLFGNAAPDDLGQITVDLTIQFSQPSSWLMNRYPKAIRNAVERRATNSLHHFLIAMLRGIHGYSAEETTNFLYAKDLLSEAAATLAQLFHKVDTDDDSRRKHIDLAIKFWKQALKRRSGPLPGFGYYAPIQDIDTETWADLTSQTLELGSIDLPWIVAERAAALPSSATTLKILNKLIRNSTINEWDQQSIRQHAAQALSRSQHLIDTPEYRRLHTAVHERMPS